MFDEAALLEKLRKIEALHAGAATEGERAAAAQAAQRITERLAQTRAAEPDVIRQYSIHDTASRRLFIALCRRYGLRPYGSRLIAGSSSDSLRALDLTGTI